MNRDAQVHCLSGLVDDVSIMADVKLEDNKHTKVKKNGHLHQDTN